MTSATSSAPPIDRHDLINTMLELPEKDFLDLIDIRLKRPKGFRQLTNILGEEYIEIIDANDKPSIIERLTESALVDELAFQLAITKRIVSHKARCGIIVHKYYDQALARRKWIPIAKPVPKFKINLSDFSARLVAELWCLKDPQYVLKEAVGRIFENIDERQYHQSIARNLKVELVK
jgi:hypothetical protein